MALAWLRARPGVTSIIIGARRLAQLDDNLDALDLTLGAEHVEALDRLSEPVLNFPARFLTNAANLMHNGATVNGEADTAKSAVHEVARRPGRLVAGSLRSGALTCSCGMMPEFS